MTKIKQESLEIFKITAIIAVIYLIISLIFNFVPPLNQYSTYSIKTDSMEDLLMIGDLVIVKEIDPADLKEEDIAAFYADINNDGVDEVVIHYIDKISDNDGLLTFKTHPETTEDQDPWTLTEDDIIGIYSTHIGGIGNFIMFLQTWPGRIFLLIDVMLILFIIDMFKEDKNPN